MSVAGVVSARLTPVVEQQTFHMIALGRMFPAIYSLGRALQNQPWFARAGFRHWFYNMDTLSDAEWSTDRAMAIQPGIHISAHRAGQAIRALNLADDLSKITSPTLAIVGQYDAVVPITDGYLIAERVPNSQLVIIDQCGHFPMYERKQEYLAALRSFLIQ